MKRRNEFARRGAVLLLILGLMAMFAISILSYMIVTSNMAETAQNSQKLDAVVEAPAASDIDYAIKNLVVGSENENNPVGPFSLLENMYGDWKEYATDNNGVTSENSDASFVARIALFPHLGIAVLTPTTNLFEYALSDNSYERMTQLSYMFENSGGVLTFEDLEDFQGENSDAVSALWKKDVANSSAFVLEKVSTNPSAAVYLNQIAYKDPSSASGLTGSGLYWKNEYNDQNIYGADPNAAAMKCYADFDLWHFKVELTDDLKAFLADYKNYLKAFLADDNNLNAFNKTLNAFNEGYPQVVVRLNRPAYSGSGVGGFSPGDQHDATLTQVMINSLVSGSNGWDSAQLQQMRIPFAFWTNPAAPDLVNFRRTNASVQPSARSLWAHLTNVSYDANVYNVDALPNPNWFVLDQNSEAPRLNPAYNAPDGRTLALAKYELNPDGSFSAITPSFHRPGAFAAYTYPDPNMGGMSYLDLYSGLYGSGVAGKRGLNLNSEALVASLLRKLTPRPLPYDHRNFTGGNPDLYYAAIDNYATANGVNVMSVLANNLAGSGDWDVDNDGDGVKDGIWVPSGLPIRYDKNGTPYATMFSYTVLDLDGRVNVNAAGSWDQLQNNVNGSFYDPYDYVGAVRNLWQNQITGGVGSGSPFWNADDLTARVGADDWLDDMNNSVDGAIIRGEGRGPASLRLAGALTEIFDAASDADVNIVASNLLWRRYMGSSDDAKPDLANLNWNVYNGLQLNGLNAPQPGYYSSAASGGLDDRTGREADDNMGTLAELFRFMNPLLCYESGSVKSGDTVVAGDNTQRRFPWRLLWRGKTTIDPTTISNSAPGVSGVVNLTPVFDFADTAFRSYDVLGHQVYSYAPRYSNNPYLAYQNAFSLYDSAYTLPDLERLLRPFDVDAKPLSTSLVDDLGMNTDDWGNEAVANQRRKARLNLTTTNADVPSPSLVFPENFKNQGEPRYGNYGFVDLIRRNVRTELYRVFEVKGICQKATVLDSSNNPVELEGSNTLLDGNEDFNQKVEQITQYLASMLPKEILAGEKIDLNALTQKNYWLDVEKDTNGNYVVAGADVHNKGLVKRMEFARGLYIVVMTLLYEDMNARQLYARQLQELDPDIDLNNGVGLDGDVFTSTNLNSEAVEVKLSPYVEGSFDLLSFEKNGGPGATGGKEKKDLMGRELMATRIAQWCANVVDFTDSDATMTPFYFDPTPFDGWWVDFDNTRQDMVSWIDGPLDVNNPDAGTYATYWENGVSGVPEIHFLFDPSYGVPAQIMEEFFRDALDQSVNSTPSVSPYQDYSSGEPSNKLIAQWMTRKIEKLEDQASDLGFRCVWGMERPDLVLTETLAFHDLGIADTDKEIDSGAVGAVKTADGDSDFDQVKRPKGSAFLELYCTANPNVPQSPDLYDEIHFKDASNNDHYVWKLRLSKRTPAYVDSLNRKIDMPVWRVAISESADLRGLNTPEEFKKLHNTDADYTKKTKDYAYHKARNSVLNWLAPSMNGDDYDGGFSFFSMQPRQFRNLPLLNDDAHPKTINSIADLDLDQGLDASDAIVKSDKVGTAAEIADATKLCLNDWEDFNLYSSNILGPAVAAVDGDKEARMREVELDRIVWFTSAVDRSASLPSLSQYPDTCRIFTHRDVNLRDPIYLEPNQYFVVGSDDANPSSTSVGSGKRAIGSASFASTNTDESQRKFGQNPNPTAFASSYIDLNNLGTSVFSGNYVWMPAVANVGPVPASNANYNNKYVGFNISEPLWTANEVDPYDAKNDKAKRINPDMGPSATDVGVRDLPYELPKAWGNDDKFNALAPGFYDNKVANYPIVKDQLFGLGVVPGYKSAFVQRVADPNRPYHPLMNPYITVDWNMMDLTVFTGDCAEEQMAEAIDSVNKRSFTDDGDYPFKDKENRIQLARNVALGFDDDDKEVAPGKDKMYDVFYGDAFSSRQWGSTAQKFFAPKFNGDDRPNPWARAVRKEGNKAGLEKPEDITVTLTSTYSPAFTRRPEHTLGVFNDRGKLGSWVQRQEPNPDTGEMETVTEFVPDPSGTIYKGLNPNYMASSDVYAGAPRIPFEHLVWNDAPFGAPYELMMVPASAPGRFGLEFVRDKDVDLSKMYSTNGGSLGSFGFFGFSEWYTDDNIKVKLNGTKYEKDDDLDHIKSKVGATGPYLNFFAGSKVPGETLNLGRLLEFVHVPSTYPGARKLAGYDQYGYLIQDGDGNVVIRSKRSEPGKINLNTTSKPAWQAVSPSEDLNGEFSGTTWDEFVEQRENAPFQPTHTATASWIAMDGSPAPDPGVTSLIGKSVSSESASAESLFDNLGGSDRDSMYVSQDDAGNDVVTYEYSYDEVSPETGETAKKTTTIQLPVDPWLHPGPTDDVEAQIESLTGLSDVDVIGLAQVGSSPFGNYLSATAEMQRLSGLTTTRSNTFAAWITVGYFEVERLKPGVNIPSLDPDGNTITFGDPTAPYDITNPNYKWYQYYKAIYPDGYTYGKEVGSEFGETKRHRGFTVIDRSIPVDFRRGNSLNYGDAILMKRVIE